MWIFTRNAFLSIVQHDSDERLMHVRARVEGDIETMFPEAEVVEMPHSDFLYHAVVRRERASAVVERELRQIDYTDFKQTIPNPDRRDAYLKVWEAMYELQQVLNKVSG